MLKSTEAKSVGGVVTLRLAGRIIGPWVVELRQICEPLVSDGSRLTLDLIEVTYADEDGAMLLASLRKRGVNLLNLTPFVEAQLQSVPT